MPDNAPTLQKAVQKFAADLAAMLQGFINDVTTVEIRTYATDAEQEWTDIK